MSKLNSRNLQYLKALASQIDNGSASVVLLGTEVCIGIHKKTGKEVNVLKELSKKWYSKLSEGEIKKSASSAKSVGRFDLKPHIIFRKFLIARSLS